MNKNTFQDMLFAALQEYGSRIAVECGKEQLTYSGLAEKANCIANWLINRGYKKGSFIGIYTDEKIELIAAIIGILTAGCVFVPLDTIYPLERIKNMINFTHIRLVICDMRQHKKLFNNSAGFDHEINPLLLNESFYKENRSLHKAGVEKPYDPEDQIYIYCTSGSTGTPKAIIGKNKGLHHFINWEIDRFAVDETCRFSQFTAPGFDVFLRDIFVPLCAGGVVCIPESREILLDGNELAAWLDTRGINFVHCVPSLFRLFNNKAVLRGRHFKNLKYILFAGEKVNPADLEEWYDLFAERIQLVNLYGPTETTLAKLFHLIKRSDVEQSKIPIGKPINGARAIILDRDMKICDKGIAGEIYIRTPYRTFGYYNAPELNRERFVRNPFNPDPEDIIYRTGDLGRVLPDGNIEWVGRVDNQVKIRGFRIEPEEIESRLLSHDDIKEAVVTGREDEEGEKYLCAYIVPKNAAGAGENLVTTPEISTPELRKYLSQSLPDYMIPAYFTFLEKMPLGANGKINRRVLPEPEKVSAESFIAPRDKLEEDMAQTWSYILNIDSEIGIDDNFFELGGHSLRAFLLVTRIHEVLDVKIPLTEVFRSPNIRGLCAYVKSAKKEKYTLIEKAEKREYYALSSAQKRLFLLQQLQPHKAAYNIPKVVTLEGEPDRSRLVTALRKLIQRHDSLRTYFVMIDKEPAQKIHRPENIKFEIEYYEMDTMQEAAGVREKQGSIEYAVGARRAVPSEPATCNSQPVTSIIEHFIRPFDLSIPPLLRVGLIKLEKAKYILMVDMHHTVSDGTSLIVIVHELITLYESKELQPPRLQYRDFSEWQGRSEMKKAIENQEAYWLNRFAGDLPRLQLPTDYERPAMQSFTGDRISFLIGRQETLALRRCGLEEEVTQYMMTLALLNVLLFKISGQEDIVVGTGTAGRWNKELQQVIGMFVNTLALRNFPSENRTFREFLQQVKECTLEAFENQDYQFEELAEKIEPQRYGNRNPVFDVVLNFNNIEVTAEDMGSIEVPGLRIKPYEFVNQVARFDLFLMGQEGEETVLFIFEYSTDLFNRESIERFIGYFREIIDTVTGNIDIKLKDIAISHDLLDTELDILYEERGDFVF